MIELFQLFFFSDLLYSHSTEWSSYKYQIDIFFYYSVKQIYLNAYINMLTLTALWQLASLTLNQQMIDKKLDTRDQLSAEKAANYNSFVAHPTEVSER